MNSRPPDDREPPPPPSPSPRDELEARLTALILGEAGDFEAETLRARIAADPEIAALYRQLEAAAGVFKKALHPQSSVSTPAPDDLSPDELKKLLAQPVLPNTPAQLSSDRRAALEKLFVPPAAPVTPIVQPAPRKRRTLIILAEILAVAACLAIIAAIFVPVVGSAVYSAHRSTSFTAENLTAPGSAASPGPGNPQDGSKFAAAQQDMKFTPAPFAAPQAGLSNNGINSLTAPAPPSAPKILSASDYVASTAASTQPLTTGNLRNSPGSGSGFGGGGYGHAGISNSAASNLDTLNNSAAFNPSPSAPTEASADTAAPVQALPENLMSAAPTGGVPQGAPAGAPTVALSGQILQAPGENANTSSTVTVSGVGAITNQSQSVIAPTSQMLAGNPTQNTSQAPSRLLAQDFPDQAALISSADAGANPSVMSNSYAGGTSFVGGTNNSSTGSSNSNITIQSTLDYKSQYIFRGKKDTNQDNQSPFPPQPGSSDFGGGATSDLSPGSPPNASVADANPVNQAPGSLANATVANYLTTGTVVASASPQTSDVENASAQPTQPAADADLPSAHPPAPVQFPAPVAAADNPFSTFALNVNDASYRLAVATLQHRQWPQPGDVRTEEFLNAFNYHDPAPASGAACALHSDLAQDPFETGRDLLRVSFQTAATGRSRTTPLHLTILLDSSGSMTRSDRVATLQAAIAALGAQLRPGDSVSLVTFARTPQVRLLAIPAENFSQVADTIAHLVPEGGTNLEEALNAAYAVARAHFDPAAQNRVILLTDGAANLGDVDPAALAKIVDQARRAGIALDAYGIGFDGYDDTVLEALTRHSDGRYAFLNRPEDVNDAFAAKLAGALTPAALDVKIQIEFNPARVATYRLMGYNNLRLTRQQFRDNTVAAGELAAAEQGTALYALVLNPQGTGPVGTARARFRDPATGEVHEWTWTLPYTGAPPAFDQAPPALRLAAVAAYFAEYLQQGPSATEVSPRVLLDALRGVPEALAPDPRPATLVEALNNAAVLAGR